MDANNIQTSADHVDERGQQRSGMAKVFVLLAKVIGFVLFLGIVPLFLVFWIQPVQNLGVKLFSPGYHLVNDSVPVDYEKVAVQAEKELVRNRTKLNAFVPKQSYIVINITENKFWLYDAKNNLVREGVCSTGSQVILDNGVRKWTFKTPKGVHKIISKVKNPVWTKPDWAFIEEGLPVPGPRHPSRYEPGVLGDFALHMGDGYMIHGTIYQRFLGMPVTHGCVRLGDKELEDVFKTLVVGSKVFVY
ncbi:MAG: L,D-transpeptidase [Breznakibacter sp.]